MLSPRFPGRERHEGGTARLLVPVFREGALERWDVPARSREMSV